MAESAIAEVVTHGQSQMVRLPEEFRVPGNEVRVRRVGRGILLEPIEPIETDLEAWLASVAELADPNFPDRDQPPMPPEKDMFD
jgi:antitoxin VapB